MSVSDPSITSPPGSPKHAHPIRTTTLVTTRSVVFSSSLYNSNATLSEDQALPTALPVLTPPLTPMAWQRSLPHPSAMVLAGTVGEEKQDVQEQEEDGSADEEAAAEQSQTVRSRRVKRSQTRKHTESVAAPHQATAPTSTTTSSALSSSLPTTQPTPADATLPTAAQPARIHPSQLVPSYPFHRKSQPSALSQEAPPVSLRGLYNLAGITLFTLTARLVLENLLKYGWVIRMNMVYALSEDWNRTWPCLLIAFFVCCISPLLSYAIERHGGEGERWERWLGWIHALHIVCVFVVPQVIITVTNASVLSGLILVMVVMVMTMKLVSFAHVCHDIRHRIRLCSEGKLTAFALPASSVQDVSALHPVLPEQYTVRLSHVLYFMLAPTLIYQLSYPKSNADGHIRVAFLVRRVIELVFCFILQLLIIEQYLYPTVRNAMESISGLRYLSILERILKIALPNGQFLLHRTTLSSSMAATHSQRRVTCVFCGMSRSGMAVNVLLTVP